MAFGKPQVSFTFPYRWLTDAESKPYLKENLLRSVRGGMLKEIYPTTGTDSYFAEMGDRFVPVYAILLKYHAYQPVKIPITQKQLETIFSDIYPGAKCVGFQTFFVQTNDPVALPVMEMEIYYK